MSRTFFFLLVFQISTALNLPAQTQSTVTIADPALRQELLERLKRDQAIRNEWNENYNDAAIRKRVESIDLENTSRMKEIVKQYGWPNPELVGKDGSSAAFILVQHGDYSFQKEMLPLIRNAALVGNLEKQDYALLLDRVLVKEGKPQIYGTQAKPKEPCQDPVFYPIQDEANVEQRRSELGLISLTEYKSNQIVRQTLA
jgi:hypothetical protein